MREIELTKGYVALIDDEDYDWLSKLKWQAQTSKRQSPYAKSGWYSPTTKKMGVMLMHRLIMNAPKDMVVDHKNHNTLDNRKGNLRVCTRSQNRGNSLRPKNNKSGYRGVYRHKSGRWHAILDNNGIGYFSNIKDAALAFNKAAIEKYGEFACLNQV